jgi:hypothetical protein
MTQKERDRITVLETKLVAMHETLTGLANKLDTYLDNKAKCLGRISAVETHTRLMWAVAVLIIGGLVAIFFKA